MGAELIADFIGDVCRQLKSTLMQMKIEVPEDAGWEYLAHTYFNLRRRRIWPASRPAFWSTQLKNKKIQDHFLARIKLIENQSRSILNWLLCVSPEVAIKSITSRFNC